MSLLVCAQVARNLDSHGACVSEVVSVEPNQKRPKGVKKEETQHDAATGHDATTATGGGAVEGEGRAGSSATMASTVLAGASVWPVE